MKPTTCIQPNPTASSIWFGRTWINLSEVSKVTGLHHSYFSHILAGRKNPTLNALSKIAYALSLSTGEFVELLEEYHRKQALIKKEARRLESPL
jgi:transcriptional regulator with XRE-family HTH domain